MNILRNKFGVPHRVTDLATGCTYRNIHCWATHRVWCYVKNYAA